jgi:hypothetical protein
VSTTPSVSDFKTEREAKEFLVAQIASEAELEGFPLSDLERKMLYFSENGWTLPDMLELNAEFERTHDNEEYEQKIAGLVREIEKRNEIAGGVVQSKWDDAVVKLSEGDHYLLVLIGLGRSSASSLASKWLPARDFYGTGKARPRGDFLRVILVALFIILIMISVFLLSSWIKNRFGN